MGGAPARENGREMEKNTGAAAEVRAIIAQALRDYAIFRYIQKLGAISVSSGRVVAVKRTVPHTQGVA
jgi:hypothetical protein